MFLLGHPRHKVYPQRWMQMSLLAVYHKKPVFGENGKKILVVLNWQLTNRPAYFVAVEMTFCVGRSDWRLWITQWDRRLLKFRDGVDGICFRNFWKSCKFGTNKWVGLYWIHFDKKALSFGQKPFNVPSKWSKYAKKIVQSCPRITGFRRLSISSQSTKPRNLLESFHQKAEWIN